MNSRWIEQKIVRLNNINNKYERYKDKLLIVKINRLNMF